MKKKDVLDCLVLKNIYVLKNSNSTQIQLTSLGLFAGSTTTTKPNKRKYNKKMI